MYWHVSGLFTGQKMASLHIVGAVLTWAAATILASLTGIT